MKDKRILPVLTDEEMGKKVLLEVLKQHIFRICSDRDFVPTKEYHIIQEIITTLESQEDIAYLKKNLFKSLKVPKDYLNENFSRCFYCSSVFSDNEFDDDYAICGKCRDKENEE